MTLFRSSRPSSPPPDASSQPVGRRGLVAGAGVAGAAALAAVALHRGIATPEPTLAKAPTDRAGEGYRETAHVLRYYETTRS